VYYSVGRRPQKTVLKVEKLREAKATTLRRVRPARSCAMGVKDAVGEVKVVDELGIGVVCRGARSKDLRDPMPLVNGVGVLVWNSEY